MNIDLFEVADVAAELFAKHRTSKHPFFSSSSRSIVRQSAVNVLRSLWKSSNPEDRVRVAIRVAIWMESYPASERDAFIKRIRSRERARLEAFRKTRASVVQV